MQKYLYLAAAFLLLPFFISAQPIISGATRVKLFKGDSIFTAPLSSLSSSIGAGGNRPDSAFATGAYNAPVYWQKSVESNIWKKGTLSLRTADTSGVFNLKDQGPNGTVRKTTFSMLSANRSRFGDGAFANGSFWNVSSIDANAMRPNHYPSLLYGVWRDQINIDSTTNLAINKPGNHIRNVGFNIDGAASWLPKWYWSTEQAYYPGAGNSGGLDWEQHLEVTDTLGRLNRPFNLLGSHNGNKYSAGYRVNEYYIGKPFESDYALRINLNTGQWSTDEPYAFTINNNTRVGPILRRLHSGSYQNVLDWRPGGNLYVGDLGGIDVFNSLKIRQSNSSMPRIITSTNNLRFDSTELTIATSGSRHIRMELNAPGDYMDMGYDGTDWFLNKNSSNYPFLVHKNARTYAFRLTSSGKIALGSNNAFFDLDEFQTTNDLGGGIGLRNLAQEWFTLRCSAAKNLVLGNDQQNIEVNIVSGVTDPETVRTGSPGDIAFCIDSDSQSSMYHKNSGAATNTGWSKILNRKDGLGASTGQVLKWNGSIWTPDTDNTAGSLPSGTSTQTLRYDATNTLVATSQITNDGSTVGIGTAPNASYELDVAGKTRSQGLRAEGTTMQPSLELANTTPTTGKTFTLGSSNTGTFYISSDVAGDAISVNHATGDVTITPKLILNNTGTTATSIIGLNASSEVSRVTIGSGLSLSGGTLSATGGGGAPSVIRPAQITSDQDNYAPSGFADATSVIIDCDNNFRAITSLSATGVSDGERKTLLNKSATGYFYVPAEHPDGTVENRVSAESDIIVGPKGSVDIEYDATAQRWAVINLNPGMQKKIRYEWQSGTITAGDWGNVTYAILNSATISNVAPSTNAPSHLGLGTGSSSTAAAYISLNKSGGANTIFRLGDAHMQYSTQMQVSALSNGTDRYTVAAELMNATNVSTVGSNSRSFGIRYSDNLNSGKFQGFTRSTGGTEETVDLGVTVAANTTYLLTITADKANSEFRFYINGIFSGRLTSNVSTADAIGCRTAIAKSLGTTAVTCRVWYSEFNAYY